VTEAESVNSTPNFFIDGRRSDGNLPDGELLAALESANGS
jgi:hypothetical protein